MRIRQAILGIAAMSLCLGTSTALAQLSVGIGDRPGQMVSAGVFRAQDFGGPVQITETGRPGSVRSDFLVEAVNIILTQISQAVDAFAALIVLRSGGIPALPALPTLPDTATTSPPDTSNQPRRKTTPTFKPSRRGRR